MSDSAAGFYGKLPATGDFVQRRLAASFVNEWDDWLQHVLHLCRDRLGERWLEIYLNSPLWRFALAPGACGDRGHAGVLVPSVDSVGRYFPLAVARPMRPEETALSVTAGSQQWFEAAQHCVVEALQNRAVTLDQFDQSILSLASSQGALPATSSDAATGDHFEKILGGIDEIGAHIAALAGDRVDGHLSPASHWWTAGSDRLNPTWICARGLPSPDLFLRMLSGEDLQSSARNDGDLLAGLLGSADHNPTRIDDTRADILGLFDLDSSN